MSASRAEPSPSGGVRWSVALALTLTAAGWTAGWAPGWVGPATAQIVGPPIRLTPQAAVTPPPVAVPEPSPVAPPPPPAPLASSMAAPSPAPSMAVIPTVPPPAVIWREALGPLDPDGAGLLTGAQGLGGDPWRGIGRAELLPLIAALPVNTPSPAAKALQRRLLLSAGSPASQPDEAPPARRFGALRIEKLAAIGDPRAAADLAAKLPEALAADEAAARALTNSELLVGPIDCAKAQERGRSFDDLYWRKLELFCRARSGDRAGADLTLAMLRERASRTDPFLAIAEALTDGASPPARSLKDSAPLTLAAMRAARIGVPPDALALTDPAALAAVATNPSTDPATRVAAGERAAAALFLDARQLLDLYGVVPAKGDELLRVKDIAGRDRSPRIRALVHQAMAAAMDGSRRVALAALAVDLVEPALRAGPVGNAAAGLLDTVSPGADSVALAPAAARLYYALGRLDAAKRWHDLALRSGKSADVGWLWPLAAVSSARGADSGGLSAWLDEVLRGADGPARARIAGQLALLQAVGVAVPDEAWMIATDGAGPPVGGTGVDPALWQRLGDAANGGRIGETVVTALLLLGEGGPTGVSPVVVARVAANLRAVGLEPDGRALAREAMAALAGVTGPASAPISAPISAVP